MCIFGHYGIMPGHERGRGNAFCVDYAVGKRHLERLKGVPPFKTKLAAPSGFLNGKSCSMMARP